MCCRISRTNQWQQFDVACGYSSNSGNCSNWIVDGALNSVFNNFCNRLDYVFNDCLYNLFCCMDNFAYGIAYRANNTLNCAYNGTHIKPPNSKQYELIHCSYERPDTPFLGLEGSLK